MRATVLPSPRLLILALCLLAALAAVWLVTRGFLAHTTAMHYFGHPLAMHYHGHPHLAAMHFHG